MKDNLVKWVIASFLVVLAILVVVAIVSVRNIQRSIATSDWVNHTQAIILETDAILSSLRAGDAALMTFLLTDNARDRTSYQTAYKEMVEEHLKVAQALTRNEPGLSQQVAALETAVSNHIDMARQTIKLRQDGGAEAVRKRLAADADVETIKTIEHYVAQIKADARRQLVERDKASHLAAQTTGWTVRTGLGINFALLALMTVFIRDDIAARQKAAKALEEANAQLEVKVQERTAELAQANQTLREENLQRRWGNQALEHQLRYSQLIINSINDLVFVISKASNITRINPAVVNTTGFQATEVIGQPLARVLTLPKAGEDGDPITIAMRQGRDLRDTAANLVNKSGRTRPIQFSLYPLRDKDKVVGAVVTVRALSPNA